MRVADNLLIVVGLSMNVFLIAQYEGTMVRSIQLFKVCVLCLIFFAFQSLAMLSGYMLTTIPFFSESSSADLRNLCYFLAGIIFLLIAGYMLYKAIRHEPIDEKLREIGYKRIVLEALMVALFTFLAGIGWGFIGHNIYRATGIIACATVIAVITGIFTGFKEGCLFRYLIYGVGGCMLAFVGGDILVRYI